MFVSSYFVGLGDRGSPNEGDLGYIVETQYQERKTNAIICVITFVGVSYGSNIFLVISILQHVERQAQLEPDWLNKPEPASETDR